MSENKRVITADNIKWRLVRYVVSNYSYGAKDAGCGHWEGIIDLEKIRILKMQGPGSKDKNVIRLLGRVEEH